jgi:Rho-binding antiterminator
MISCHRHDYIEIACLYRLRLRLRLRSGAAIEGVAVDTGSRKGREWMRVETEAGTRDLDLEDLKEIEATVDNPHFQRIELT